MKHSSTYRRPTHYIICTRVRLATPIDFPRRFQYNQVTGYHRNSLSRLCASGPMHHEAKPNDKTHGMS